ncbi:hypothetical protein PIROE2DRAFT_3250 [Piromyces sp. E2]|nr:hypothetical protein PIROE2DRAFT_3250 [Piromyces sp. E2]|eukprot:OUM69008.1 hypothetical protein PIROE2DRAFT_3250 [Piromyces sp. E2]
MKKNLNSYNYQYKTEDFKFSCKVTNRKVGTFYFSKETNNYPNENFGFFS